MTANQSTVKSDMATVDYGSFQPTKHHCLLSNCLSYPKKRKTELRGRAFPSARPVQRSYALGSNTHKALMSPLRHASGSRQSENSAHFFGVNRSNVRDSFFFERVHQLGFAFGTTGSESLRRSTHPTGLQEPHSGETAQNLPSLRKQHPRLTEKQGLGTVSAEVPQE